MLHTIFAHYSTFDVRYSTVGDYKAIKTLLNSCFGTRSSALKSLDNRYFLAIERSTQALVAMTGLLKNHHYGPGVEVDYTCTHPSYQRMGIMCQLLGWVVESNEGPFWYSAWRLPSNTRSNPADIMDALGFKLVRLNSKCWCNSDGSCELNKGSCRNYHNYGFGCYCYEDLYLKI